MNRYIRSVISFFVCTALAASYGCRSKDKISSSDVESSSLSSAVEKTSDTVSSTAAVSEDITTATTEPVTVVNTENGYDSPFDAAKNYYNAYLTNNYEAVYNMFCDEEIEAYSRYLSDDGLIGEEKPEKAFGKGNVMKAIKASIANIRQLMAENGGKPAEEWGVSLKEEDLSAFSAEEMSIFNNKLGTSFTSGYDCNFVYYTDGDDNHSFLGNDCALVEKDGRWYISYSTALSSELITFLDIY